MLRMADTAWEGPGTLIIGLNYQPKTAYTQAFMYEKNKFLLWLLLQRNASILNAVWVFCHWQPRGPK